jgi:hypothetical protein
LREPLIVPRAAEVAEVDGQAVDHLMLELRRVLEVVLALDTVCGPDGGHR